jgi:hypothetical protein
MFIKAREKMSCLKPNDIVFFIFCHFWKIDPHFRLLLKLVLHFPSLLWVYPTTFQSTYNDLQPPNFPLTKVAPPTISGPLKMIVLHFTAHSYASAYNAYRLRYS